MNKTELEIVSQDAALLSVCEIGIGSILHGFRVPLSGYFLSLNQVFLLSRSLSKTRLRTAPFSISAIAALFKSLSPAGKKLTPMLAISSQGLLFTTGCLLFGPNLVGALLGAALSSLWGFLQPLLLYYLLFGNTLVKAFGYFHAKFQESFSFLGMGEGFLLWLLLGVVALKALLASSLAALAFFLPESAFQRWQSRIVKAAGRSPRAEAVLSPSQRRSLGENLRQAWRELWNPLFSLSLLATVAFFLLAEHSWSQTFWMALRPVALGFLLFFLVKYLPLERLRARIPVFGEALAKLRNYLR